MKSERTDKNTMAMSVESTMDENEFVTEEQLKDYVNVAKLTDLTSYVKVGGTEIEHWSRVELNTLNVSGEKYLLGGRIIMSLDKFIKVSGEETTRIEISTASPYTNFKFIKNVILQGLQSSKAVGVRYGIVDILPNKIVLDAYYPGGADICFIYVVY